MSDGHLEVCIVGAGPRGLSVLERLCANARRGLPAGSTLTVHVVDPHRPGAGGVWRTDQSHHLLMNTVASQVTLFTDESVEIDGELAPGPSLYDWAVRTAAAPGEAPGEAYDDQVRAEARDLTPDSYPTRAFYGHYLEWVFRHVVRTAPAHVRVVVHPWQAVRLDGAPDGPEGPGGPQSVHLSDGSRLDGLDAVVLAQGHLPVRGGPGERELAGFARTHGLTYVQPANPADTDLSAVRPGEAVALRGLGLNFFDHLTLFTLGRGGTYTRRDGRLLYGPSGREPRLYAASRRGVPYHSRGRNQKGAHGRHIPRVLTPEVLERLRTAARLGGGLDFGRDLWPLIAKEVETVYYTALLARRAGEREAGRFGDRYLESAWGSAGESDLLDAYGIGPEDHWDWKHLSLPHAGQGFRSVGDHRDWLLDTLRLDLAESEAGNVEGPLKSALDVLRDLRNEIRLVVDHGGLTGRSHRDDLERWYTPLNAFLSIGPPAGRIEQMIALVEAGVLTVLGPGMRVGTDADQGVFTVEAPAVPGSLTRVTTLVEARLPEPDLRRTTDPLLNDLLATGQCRPYAIADPELGAYETGGLAVTPRPYRLVDTEGRAHPRRFAYGVPTESVHWATAAGVRPGVNSVTLGDSDAIALAVLALPAGPPRPPVTDHQKSRTT
ncbi:FAD/NAD(P)-binding domain-containing protein [Streptomyces sp. NP-1717]|uniref:FAD/NAD(P)-binding protein n=1 Tax=Streptomyces sp. NP-1717 TaxID=2704470 RepID=UPI001F5DB7A3|nr:FAD/NAD(P)-binding protein [Streptomyces sp. NP-1717]MCI3225150.1 FAD/NAD(P)-binding protein [Streptomyces sp. NP-1717]